MSLTSSLGSLPSSVTIFFLLVLSGQVVRSWGRGGHIPVHIRGPLRVGVGGGEDMSPYTSGGLSVESSVCGRCADNFRAKRTTHLFWFLGWWWLLDDLGC